MNTEQLLKASINHEHNKKLKGEFNLQKDLANKVRQAEAGKEIMAGFISFWLDEFEGRFDNKDITYESAQAYVEQATFFKRAYGRDDAGMITKVTYFINNFIPEEHQIP